MISITLRKSNVRHEMRALIVSKLCFFNSVTTWRVFYGYLKETELLEFVTVAAEQKHSVTFCLLSMSRGLLLISCYVFAPARKKATIKDPRVKQLNNYLLSLKDFILYSQTNSMIFAKQSTKVRRRFSEFVWLWKHLSRHSSLAL